MTDELLGLGPAPWAGFSKPGSPRTLAVISSADLARTHDAGASSRVLRADTVHLCLIPHSIAYTLHPWVCRVMPQKDPGR